MEGRKEGGKGWWITSKRQRRPVCRPRQNGFVHISCGLYVAALVFTPLFFLLSKWYVTLALTDAVICLVNSLYLLRFVAHHDAQERQRRLRRWALFGFLSIIIAVLLHLGLIRSGLVLFAAKYSGSLVYVRDDPFVQSFHKFSFPNCKEHAAVEDGVFKRDSTNH